MEAEEKKRETDKNVKRLQDEIMASIESIYQSIENIGKVNKEVAQMLITRIQTLRADTDNKQMQPVEILSELMSIQRKIIGILDTDYYKQTTMYFQTSKKELTNGFKEDFRYLVYEQLKKIEKSVIINYGGSHLSIWIDGRDVDLPIFETRRYMYIYIMENTNRRNVNFM